MPESRMAHWGFTIGLCGVVAMGIGRFWNVTPATHSLAVRAESSTVSYTQSRQLAVQTQYESKAASQRERRSAERLEHQLQVTRDSLDRLRALTLDTEATADTLRGALAVALAHADTLADRADAYLTDVELLRSQYAAERRAMTVALDKADSALAHQDALVRALQRRADCRVLGVPCPTRTQAFVAGTVVGIVLGLAR